MALLGDASRVILAFMKALFNLISLTVLAAGGFYLYLNVTDDYETLAKIKNVQDRVLVELQYFLDDLRQDADDLKQDAQEKKRSVGL